ncbi:MAG TPA: YebC/PmpR family DNA-binding transcriptional regulator [Planctomycetota bacterium]|nr:YebC/PmpR family DNA-binding transcriptional regulator [Planctomycetota bacterium]
MSGHSHWATIKHKKGAADARRGKLWSKLSRAIQIAAKEGGGNPDMNLKLANAIEDARAESVPRDNIERSIKRGTGEIEGVTYEQVTYEGYGPGGTAIMVDALTDNKNRSAAEMRKIFEHSGGSLGGARAVAFMFHPKGALTIPVSAAGEDQMMNDVLDAGAENMETQGEVYFITCAVPDFENVKKALGKKYKLATSEVTMLPKDPVKVDEETGRKILNLMEALDDSEDVQKIHTNFILPESLLKS